MSSTTAASPLNTFVSHMLGLPAWGVRQGHGSFLTFEFGQPSLHVSEWHAEKGLRRSAVVYGQWHLWIYCCHWRALQDRQQAASSEDEDTLIGRAAAKFNGQKLVAVDVEPSRGRSCFAFDLGGELETWPSGDDPAEQQWMIIAAADALAYRADGSYMREPNHSHDKGNVRSIHPSRS